VESKRGSSKDPSPETLFDMRSLETFPGKQTEEQGGINANRKAAEEERESRAFYQAGCRSVGWSKFFFYFPFLYNFRFSV
jgi:hypothetical protein